MIRQEYIDIKKIIKDPKIFRLFRIVKNYGGVLRLVGGCVRDVIMGLEDYDLDFATDLSPDELVEACSEKGIKTIPIGIKFGTVGVLIGEELLEVTSLRKEIESDGRYPVVEFTENWEVDASRRDLTINAVYADEQGNVFDYYDGIDDLENGIVKFIGNPEKRIQEDYLRIMRFFRFYSIFSKGTMDKESFKACVKYKDGLKNISTERVRDEFKKILMSPKALKTIKIMFENGILDSIMPTPKDFNSLEFLVEWFDDRKIGDTTVRRYMLLYKPDEKSIDYISNVMKLSNKTKEHFISLIKANFSINEILDRKTLKKLIYIYGKTICIDKLIIIAAQEKRKIENIEQIIDKINNMVMPILPISGKDIVALNISGHKIGKILDTLEKSWLDSNFHKNREDLIVEAEKLVKELS